MSKDYVVCIPSYKRANVCKEKTLTMLHKYKMPASHIYVYVANKEEYDLYKDILDPSTYNKLVIGKKGIAPQRQFIMEQWPEGKHIVYFDDDVTSIDFSLSPRFKKHGLDYFIKNAFEETAKLHAYIWGVYAVYNPYFRKGRPEVSTALNYIVGCFYGVINRPKLQSIKLTITKENGQKEDVERSIKFFIEDGIVVRFNKIGFMTKYYGKEGGLGTFENRIKPMMDASKRLEAKYSDYGYIKVRKNGMAEFVLKKIPSTVGNTDDSDDSDDDVKPNAKTKKRVRSNKSKKSKKSKK